MKWNPFAELPQLLILAAMFMAALILWDRVPEQLPVHWNLQGEVDRFGSRFEGLVLVPLIGVGLYLVMLFAPLLDRGKQKDARFHTMYAVIRLAVMVFLAVVYVSSIQAISSESHALGPMFAWALAGLFFVLGGCIRSIRPNRFVGVRTPWTLDSATTWRQTHELAGWLFMAMGIGIGLCILLEERWVIIATIGFSLLSLVAIVLSSYLFWRMAPDRGRL